MNDWAKDRVVDPEPLLAMEAECRSSLFDPVGRKWWGDGTPLSKTSLLVATYADGGHGAMSADRSDFDRMIEEARRGGLVRVHAMGDGTVHIGLPLMIRDVETRSIARVFFENNPISEKRAGIQNDLENIHSMDNFPWEDSTSPNPFDPGRQR